MLSMMLKILYFWMGRSTSVAAHTLCLHLYDLASHTWHYADANMELGWQGPSVVVDNTLYVLDQNSGTSLMMWEKDKREWVATGRFSPLLTRPPCRLVAMGRKIFIVGKGLWTVVFDIDKMGNMGGIMVGRHVHKRIGLRGQRDSCKCVAL